MNIIFLDLRPFAHFVRNGFRQRVGRILYHLIHSDRVERFAYVWWNEEPNAGILDELPAKAEYREILLHEARRVRIPFGRSLGLAGGLIDRPRIRKATEVCRKFSGEPLWIWATDARLAVSARKLANKLNCKLCCDLIDNFAVRDEYENSQKLAFRKAYETAGRLADKVVANNPDMQSFLEIPNNKLKCVLNGVDLKLFNGDVNLSEPLEIARIPHPRVGFVGILSALTDVNLLNAVAQEIPECEVICVGPTKGANHPLHPRIHALGMKPYDDIPSYVVSFDVCLSIYRRCSATQYIDSQKVYEYLAAGKLVVVTDANNHTIKSAYVRVAGSVNEFVSIVREIIAQGTSSGMRKKISQSVAKHEWKSRIGEILDFLEEP